MMPLLVLMHLPELREFREMYQQWQLEDSVCLNCFWCLHEFFIIPWSWSGQNIPVEISPAFQPSG